MHAPAAVQVGRLWSGERNKTVASDQIAFVRAVRCNAVKTTVPSGSTLLCYHLSQYAAREPAEIRVLEWKAGEQLQQQQCQQRQQHRQQQQ
jgi:hypothetical protein